MNEGMTPEAKVMHEAALRSVGLPVDTRLCVFGMGKVRHVYGKAKPRSRSVTWCNMFYQANKVRDCQTDWKLGDEMLPICGACLRTFTAVLAQDAAAS